MFLPRRYSAVMAYDYIEKFNTIAVSLNLIYVSYDLRTTLTRCGSRTYPPYTFYETSRPDEPYHGLALIHYTLFLYHPFYITLMLERTIPSIRIWCYKELTQFRVVSLHSRNTSYGSVRVGDTAAGD